MNQEQPGDSYDLYELREAVMPMLSEKRVAHVAGTESEAVRLAHHWGENDEEAAVAAILHDCTKKLSHDEQLKLCREYGIVIDKNEEATPKLLHAKTGAEVAKRQFGVNSRIYEAIRWHTTAKPDMTLLEKIMYLADYIEPTRDFEGVEELRELAYEDIDKAMALGLKMSIEEITAKNTVPYKDTIEAYLWYAGEGD